MNHFSWIPQWLLIAFAVLGACFLVSILGAVAWSATATLVKRAARRQPGARRSS